MKSVTRSRDASTCELAWEAIDRAASASNPTGNTIQIDLTFDGDSCQSWYHPSLAPVMCALCGKNCRERGELPCVRINPYCG